MKKNILVIMALSLVVSAKAQKVKESQVPKAVTDSFKMNFPGVKVEAWEKEKNGDFEAEFDLKKQECSATFSADGILKETERELRSSAISKQAGDYIAQKYPEYKIVELCEILKADKTTVYEVEVKKGKQHKDLLFDGQWNFMKEEIETKD